VIATLFTLEGMGLVGYWDDARKGQGAAE
jgi:hypothetical protein